MGQFEKSCLAFPRSNAEEPGRPDHCNRSSLSALYSLTQIIILERRKNGFIEGTVPVYDLEEEFVSLTVNRTRGGMWWWRGLFITCLGNFTVGHASFYEAENK